MKNFKAYRDVKRKLEKRENIEIENLENFVADFEKLFFEKDTLDSKLKELSRKSSMGEMIDIIAHQWKQPLTIISLYNHMLPADYDYGIIDKEYIDSLHEKVDLQVEHLLETLHEFRDFLRPDRKEETFSAHETIKSAVFLLEDIIKGNQINLKISAENDFSLIGSKNDFKHIFINMVNNSKDAFVEKEISKRRIDINIIKEDEKFIIEYIDTAGGVPQKILQNIFEPNITTKSTGTGMGMYMTRMIIEKLNGHIEVLNYSSVDSIGAKFRLEFRELVKEKV
ncbi:signal transduction histidine kinase [Thiovulum sp. ES]|nr:signal transduction histidine kinase [Thiovulum sp. ES]